MNYRYIYFLVQLTFVFHSFIVSMLFSQLNNLTCTISSQILCLKFALSRLLVYKIKHISRSVHYIYQVRIQYYKKKSLFRFHYIIVLANIIKYQVMKICSTKRLCLGGVIKVPSDEWPHSFPIDTCITETQRKKNIDVLISSTKPNLWRSGI